MASPRDEHWVYGYHRIQASSLEDLLASRTGRLLAYQQNVQAKTLDMVPCTALGAANAIPF